MGADANRQPHHQQQIDGSGQCSQRRRRKINVESSACPPREQCRHEIAEEKPQWREEHAGQWKQLAEIPRLNAELFYFPDVTRTKEFVEIARTLF